MRTAFVWVGLIVLESLFIVLMGGTIKMLGASEGFAYGFPNFLAGAFSYWYFKREGWL